MYPTPQRAPKFAIGFTNASTDIAEFYQISPYGICNEGHDPPQPRTVVPLPPRGGEGVLEPPVPETVAQTEAQREGGAVREAQPDTDTEPVGEPLREAEGEALT